MEIDREDAITALRRVCMDVAFVRAPQLRRLLEFLVLHAIDGKPPLKAYTIGVEALGRPDHFDPDQDTIVRVQAGRLRRALNRYYTTEGKNDPVRISLPAGNYAVHFEQRDAAVDAETKLPARKLSRQTRAVVFAAVAALIIVALSMLALHDATHMSPGSPAAVATVAPNAYGKPTIVILPFNGPGGDIDVPTPVGLRREMASAFSKFEIVNVVYVPRRKPGEPIVSWRPADDERAYSLSGWVVQRDDVVRVQFQLGDLNSGTVIWTQDFELPSGVVSGIHQEHIVRRLATTLVQPFGVIASRERARHVRAGAGDPHYRCVLEASEAMRDASDEGYASARTCLERVIASDPSYALAHASLAAILNRIFQFGWPVEPGILDRALAAARRAVHTDPASAQAHFALFVTHFNMRQFDAADEAMAQVRALNDHDLVMRSVYGGRLITRGRIDEGMAILDEVEHSFPARSCTLGFYVFLGHYLRGNPSEAQRRAHELTCPTYPFAFIAKALVAINAGRIEKARTALESAATLLPGWHTDPRSVLERTIPDGSIVERILSDLAGADMAVTTHN